MLPPFCCFANGYFTFCVKLSTNHPHKNRTPPRNFIMAGHWVYSLKVKRMILPLPLPVTTTVVPSSFSMISIMG